MRRRLAVSVAAVTATLLIAFLLPLGYLVERIARDREINAATAQARSLGPLLGGSDPRAVAVTVESAIREDGRPVALVLPDGTEVGGGVRISRDALELARRGQAFVHSVEDGVDVYQPVVGFDGRTEVLVVHSSDARLREGVVPSWLVLGGLGLVMLAGALVVADRVARSATRPLGEVATAARRLAEGDEAARAPDAGPPEVKSVAHALNLLADRVDALREAERERLADLSHDLRTPVAALRLDAEHLAPGVERDRLLTGVERLEAAITGLITSARRGAAADRDGPVDLAAAVRHRIAFWSVAATGQHRTFTATVPDGAVWVPVGPRALDAAIDALVDNALRHTAPGTDVSVAVTATDTHAALAVEDAGSGFLSDAVVGRGVQGEATGGTGLGLDIVRRTAAAGGGELHLGRSAAGGARVVMRLHRVAPPG